MKFEKYTLKNGEVRWSYFHYFGVNSDTGIKEDVRRRGFKTQADARQDLLKRINEYKNERKIVKQNKNNFKFNEVIELWLIHYEQQVKVTTFTNTKNLFRLHIIPYFGDIFINKIDVRSCQNAVNDWYASYSDATRLVNITRQIFNFGINQGFCHDNPMNKIIKPKNTHKEEYSPPFYEKDDLLLFLKTVKENENIQAHSMFHVLAFTGLRRGELFALKWKDVDFEKKMLNVERNLIYNQEEKRHEFSTLKTRSSRRVISIDNQTTRVLLTWRNFQREFFLGRGMNVNSPEQLIFTSQNNHYMSDVYLRRIVKRITKETGLPHITIHGFRHTHCSLLFAADADMNAVKDRLGHSDIQTTMNIYAHVTKTERDKTADIFEDFMESSF